MKKYVYPLLTAGLLSILAACGMNARASAEWSDATRSTDVLSTAQEIGRKSVRNTTAGEEQSVTYEDMTQVSITVYLQHIVITPAAGDKVTVRWISEGDETLSADNGRLELTFKEPDWLAKDRASDGTPRFSVVSAIYVELPETVDIAEFYSNLGNVFIDGVTGCRLLKAETIDGDATVRGAVGRVTAKTGRGTIGPEDYAADIVESMYDETVTSKRLDITIPGAVIPDQQTWLYSESGNVSVNEY